MVLDKAGVRLCKVTNLYFFVTLFFIGVNNENCDTILFANGLFNHNLNKT